MKADKDGDCAYTAFTEVRLPLIAYHGPETDNLPQVVRTRDLQLFMNECRLTGYEAAKKSRNVVFIEGDLWIVGYKRKRRLWIKNPATRKFPLLFPRGSFDPKLFLHHADEDYTRWQIQMYKGLGISMSSKEKTTCLEPPSCTSLAKSPKKT